MKLMNDQSTPFDVNVAINDLATLERIHQAHSDNTLTTKQSEELSSLEHHYISIGVEGINIADATIDVAARAVSLAKSIYDIIVEYLKGVIKSLGYVTNVLEKQNKYCSKLVELEQRALHTDIADTYKPITIRAVASLSELESDLNIMEAFDSINKRLNVYAQLNSRIMRKNRKRLIKVIEANTHKKVVKALDRLEISIGTAIDDYKDTLNEYDNIVYSRTLSLEDGVKTDIIGRKSITLEKPSFKTIMTLIPLIIPPSLLSYGQDLTELSEGILEVVEESKKDQHETFDDFTRGVLQNLVNTISCIKLTYNQAITYNQDIINIIAKSNVTSL